MNIAIMQPYLLPHLGYFQLMHACDEFLIYDDVAYIPRGYINRNSVLLGGKAHRFTLSVPDASPKRRISELSFAPTPQSLLTTLHHAYAKAPHYAEVMPLLQTILMHEDRRIGALCQFSFETICRYLGLECRFALTSEMDYERSQSTQDRLIELSRQRGGRGYVNSIGGRKLYRGEAFEQAGLRLSFLSSHPRDYRQVAPGAREGEFVGSLSIIDVLMWCSPADVVSRLAEYTLLSGDAPWGPAAEGMDQLWQPSLAEPASRPLASSREAAGGVATCH